MARKKQNVRTTNLGSVYPARERWAARYELPAGVNHTPGHTFATYKLADDWLREEYDLIHDKYRQWTPPAQRRAQAKREQQANQTTLKELALPWIDERTTSAGKPLAKSTKKLYRRYLANRLKALADMPIKQITPAVVSMWWQDNSDHRPDRQKAYSFLKTVLNEAVERGLTKANPCKVPNAGRRARNTSKRQRGLMISALGVEDVQAMLEAYDRPNFRLALTLCAWCGLRIGEALALTTKDFQLMQEVGRPDCWQVTITKAIADDDANGRIMTEPKTEESNRAIIAPPHLNEAIRTHLANVEPGALLFPSTNPAKAYATVEQVKGTKTTRSRGRVELTGWCAVREEYGHPDLTIHDLRHWARLIWTRAGLDGPSVEMMLGHQLPEVQGTYAHLDIQHLWDVAPKVSELAGWHNPATGALTIDPRLLAAMTSQKRLEALQALTGAQLEANAGTLKQALLEATRAQVNQQDEQSREAN